VIKVILVENSCAEDSILRHVGHIHIMDAYDDVDSLLGNTCKEKGEVIVYLAVVEGEDEKSTDEILYQKSIDRQKMREQLEEVILQSAFDCFFFDGQKCVNSGDPSLDLSSITDKKEVSETPSSPSTLDWTGVHVEIPEDIVSSAGKLQKGKYAGKRIDQDRYELYDLEQYRKAKEDGKEAYPEKKGTMWEIVTSDGRKQWIGVSE
jgi:hypothetical protein